MSARLAVATLLALTAAAPAHALEVQFEGFYRARFRVYDSLSLDRDLAASEGTAAYVQHRLWLKPRFLISDKVSVFAEIRGLDGTLWGETSVPAWDYVVGVQQPQRQALVFSDDVVATTDADADITPADLTFWRAWGEVRTPYGTFKAGRMPLHWGMGLWQNDGLGIQGEYGDTADRLMWELLVQDVWVTAAFDLNSSGLLNKGDDVVSGNATVGYRSERITAGFNTQLRYVSDPEFTLFTLDGAAEAQMGSLTLEVEALGQFGSGDLDTGEDNVGYTAFGAVLDASLDTKVVGLGLEGGIASGDRNLTDAKFRTFTFDRDYNIAAIMFEQPMPVLSQTSGQDGRSYEHTLAGDAVSNAMYIRPRVYREIVDDLEVEGAFIGARRMATPDPEQGRESYGMEFDATVRYRAYDHLDLSGTFGVFFPGTHFRGYEDSDGIYTGFDEPVYGGQVTARIDF